MSILIFRVFPELHKAYMLDFFSFRWVIRSVEDLSSGGDLHILFKEHILLRYPEVIESSTGNAVPGRL